MRLVSRCPLKTTVSFKGVNSNVKHVALCCEALKNSVNHNNTKDFPFINMLVKYTPVTSCPALWCPGTMLKKKKKNFTLSAPSIVCWAWKKLRKRLLLLRNTTKEILKKILLFIIHIYVKVLWCWASLVAQWSRICLQCRRCGFNLWVRKIPRKRAWQPTPVLLPGESRGQRSLQSTGSQRIKHDRSDLAHSTGSQSCIAGELVPGAWAVFPAS